MCVFGPLPTFRMIGSDVIFDFVTHNLRRVIPLVITSLARSFDRNLFLELRELIFNKKKIA